MNAHDINTIDTRATGRGWRRKLALALTVCLLVAPSIASASDGYHWSAGELSHADMGPFERTPTELGQTTGDFRESLSFGRGGGNDSASTDQVRIRDGSAAVPFVAWPNGAPPADADGGFEWASAVIGAGAAMGFVALGGALFLALRRRRAMAPSASTT